VIVIDASALADALLPSARGREIAPLLLKPPGALHAPTLIDAETTSAVRRNERDGRITAETATAVLADLAAAPLVRHGYRPHLARAWELRHNFTVYDALYVALAEAIDGALLTSDTRLAAAVRAHTGVALAA
jgi:predicted nucleic acid-binding protein